MFIPIGIDRGKWRTAIALPALLGLLLSSNAKPADAHRPHDVIERTIVSPDFEQDNTVYTFVRGNVFKSSDRGKTWTRIVNGLDYQSHLTSISSTGSTLYLSTAGDGIYKSTDGGTAWAKADEGLPTLEIAIVTADPNNGDLALAAGVEGGLYRTEDGGQTWQTILEKTPVITVLSYFPDSPNRVVFGNHEGEIFQSEDGGKTWKKTATLDGSGIISEIAISPTFSKDGTFWAGTEKKGIWQTSDRGATFNPTGSIPGLEKSPEGTIEALAVSPDYASDGTLFAATWNQAIFVSRDRGKTWTQYKQGITKDKQADLPAFKSPHFYDLAISPAFSKDKTLFLGGFNGLFSSTDGGQNWQELDTLSRGTVIGLDVSPNYPTDSTLALITYVGNIYISRDKGETWNNITDGLEVPRFTENFSEPEQDPRRFFDIAFSPDYASDKTIFASMLWRDFLKSDNDGQFWEIIGLPQRVRGVTIAVSPNFAEDKTIFTTNQAGVVMKSDTGGDDFNIVGKLEKVRGNDTPSLVISPDFAADNTLYAYTNEGVTTSTDGGKNWQAMTFGDPLQERRNLQLAISPNYKQDRTLFVGSDAGIFTSSDAGESWQKLAGIDGFLEAVALSPDYARDRTILASVRGQGLYKSVDGGANFRKVGNDNLALAKIPGPPAAPVPIKFSPNYASDRTIYGFGSAESEIFKSTDAGETWEVIPVPPVDNDRHDFGTRLQLLELVYGWKVLRLLIAIALGAAGYFLLGELKPKPESPDISD